MQLLTSFRKKPVFINFYTEHPGSQFLKGVQTDQL